MSNSDTQAGQMYASGWDTQCELNIDEAVKFQVKELRRKFSAAGAENLIETIWGVGYQLTTEKSVDCNGEYCNDNHSPR